MLFREPDNLRRLQQLSSREVSLSLGVGISLNGSYKNIRCPILVGKGHYSVLHTPTWASVSGIRRTVYLLFVLLLRR